MNPLEMKKFNKKILILCLFFAVTTAFWLYFIVASGYQRTIHGPLFETGVKPYLVWITLTCYAGAVTGFIVARGWGSWASVVGRALILISLGVGSFAVGNTLWVYYLFVKQVEIPYPSLTDVFFGLCPLLISFGMLQLLRGIGVKYELKKTKAKLLVIFLPILIVIGSYFLLFTIARKEPLDFSEAKLTLFFDIYYPISDMIVLSVTILAYLLSKKLIGGIFKHALPILLLGFLFMYVADFLFQFQTNRDTYFNGNINDYLFAVTFFTISVGLSLFDPKKLRIKRQEEEANIQH